MLKSGCLILSLWAVLGLFPALYFVLNIALFGGIAPALSGLDSEALAAISSDALRAANSIAVFANGTHVAFSCLILVIIWKGLYKELTWAFWSLLFCISVAIVSGAMGNFMADTLFPEADILSALVFLSGIGCSAIGLFKPTRDELRADKS